jgi:hypothetical protein
MNNVSGIATLKTNIPTLPLSAAQVNYTNADDEVKTVQTRLLEIDNELENDNEFNPSDILDQISDITGNVSSITQDVSNTIENIVNIGSQIEGIISSVTTVTRSY